MLVVVDKVCTKCKRKLPATAEYFYKRSNVKSGLQYMCKDCKNKWIKNYRSSTIKGYLYGIFAGMKQRCTYRGHGSYHRYGGRGIKVCFKSSDEFVDYVISKLQVDPRGLQIDRIDNDGNYESGNIRFVTRKENCKNRRK